GHGGGDHPGVRRRRADVPVRLPAPWLRLPELARSRAVVDVVGRRHDRADPGRQRRAVPAHVGMTAAVATSDDRATEAARAVSRWGSRSMAELAAPAVALAREGFVVGPTLAAGAGRAAPSLAADPVLGPLYAPGGQAVVEGAVVRNPALADCLATVAQDGAG